MTPAFDVAAAHRHFAAHCYNAAWDLMEKSVRTQEEDRMMEALSLASIYHWRSRPDCTDRNLSIGYWQASRVQALLGNAAEATRHAQACLSYSRDLDPFYIGYAWEALARAARLAGDVQGMKRLVAEGEARAALVTDKEDRDKLLEDLALLQQGTVAARS